MTPKTQRIYSLDVLRFIAISSVVLIHTSARYFILNTEGYVFAHIIKSITWIGVPIFVMLSGAINLSNNRDFSLRKMLSSIFIFIFILLIWSSFYSCYNTILYCFSNGKHFPSFTSLAMDAIYGLWHYGSFHLWYLPMIMGLYSITPILRLLAKIENIKIVIWFIILSLLIQFIPETLDNFLYLTNNDFRLTNLIRSNIYLDFVSGYTSYYLIGWLITNASISSKHCKYLYFIAFFCLLITIIPPFYANKNQTTIVAKMFASYLSFNILIFSVAIFTLVYRSIPKYVSSYSSKIFSILSRLTFGVYLSHMIFEPIIYHLFFINTYLDISIKFILTLCLSYLFSLLISKVPILRHLIHC